jgi:Inhibitor of Apoptosis domain
MATAVVVILFANEESPFYTEDSEIIKEVAVVDLSSFASQQWRFLNPVEDSPTFETLSYKNYLSAPGDVAYERIRQVIKKATDTYKLLYVYGEKDCTTLKNLLQRSTIFDVRATYKVEMNELPLMPGTECLYHSHVESAQICPHANAYRLSVWCVNNYSRINMLDSAARLNTFNNWSNENVDKSILAATGFFHVSTEDFSHLTECIFCGLQVFNWNQDDNPFMKHRFLSKYCTLFNFSTFSGIDI